MKFRHVHLYGAALLRRLPASHRHPMKFLCFKRLQKRTQQSKSPLLCRLAYPFFFFFFLDVFTLTGIAASVAAQQTLGTRTHATPASRLVSCYHCAKVIAGFQPATKRTTANKCGQQCDHFSLSVHRLQIGVVVVVNRRTTTENAACHSDLGSIFKSAQRRRMVTNKNCTTIIF